MSRGLFFTNHMRVLTLVAERPDVRIREIASEVGITERAAHRIIWELVDEGYITREREGNRNHYTIVRLPPLEARDTEVLARAMTNPGGDGSPGRRSATDDFHALFEAVPVGLALVNAGGTILAANPALCDLFGRAEVELVGHRLNEHVHPDDGADDEARIAQVASRTIVEHTGKKRYVRADGKLIRAEVRIARAAGFGRDQERLIVHVAEIDHSTHNHRELDEAEERFRTVFDNAPIGMALVAPDGRLLKVNRAMSEITGYSETALLTRNIQSVTHPDDLEADLELKRQVLAGERRTYQMDKRCYHADGHIIWISLSVSLVRDAAGEPLYFISQIKDITDRRAGEESAQRMIDRIAEAVSIVDSDGTHLHVNNAAQAILDDLAAPFDAGPIETVNWGAVAEDGTPLTAEQLPIEITRVTGEEIDEAVVGFLRSTGGFRWLRISTRRLTDGLAPHQVIASYTDVTRRKQAERALALSQAPLEGLFRYMPAALSLRDLDGRYLHVTDSVARALGCTPEAAVGRHPAEHLDGEVLSQMLADDEAMLAGSGPISREVRGKHPDGSDHDYFVLKWPVHDEHGAIAAFGTFSLDTTAGKPADQRIRELVEAVG